MIKSQSLTLIALLIIGVTAAIWQPVSVQQLLDWGVVLAEKPEAIALLILAQATLYALALPGTLIVWLVAPFHSIPAAVSILLTGSVLGALGAYRIASQLTESWQPGKRSWLLELLQRRSDIYTQCALRILPGCPHWAVNYGAGILKLPLPAFVAAATVGLGIKWTLYCWVISDLTASTRNGDAFSIRAVLPLVLLATLVLIGGWARQTLIMRQLKQQKGIDIDQE